MTLVSRSMAIRFQCGACSQPIEIDDEWALKAVACPYCRKTVTAPVESTLDDVSAIPTASPLPAGPASPMNMPASPYPAMTPDSHPNVIAVVALALAVGAIVVVLIVLGVSAAHANDLLALQEAIEQGAKQGQSQVQIAMDYFSADAGGVPGWVIVVGLFQFAALGLALAALACGLFALTRKRRRGLAIGAVAISGGYLFLSCANVLFQFA